jgi:acyl-CoA synthetase (AMP-forming)/AMP-acid ligase II
VQPVADKALIRTLIDVLALRARTEPSRVAIVADAEHRLTFDGWEARSNQLAHALVAAGVRKGDRIALRFRPDDWVQYSIACIAILKAGGALISIPDLLSAREIERRLAECSVSRAVHSSGVEPPAHLPGIAVDSVSPAASTLPVGVDVGGDDVAAITYTSGTTAGKSRAMVVPHRELVRSFDPERPRDYDSSRFFLGLFPIGTSSSQIMVFAAVTGVPSVAFSTQLDPESVCALIAKLRIDNVMLTPTMATDILSSGAAQRHDLSSLRDVSTGSAPITPVILERVASAIPSAKITLFYVSAETVPALTTMTFDPSRPGAVGRPIGETQIAIRDGRDLPAGEIGEICVRHPKRIRYYLSSPEAPRDSWIHTGDLGYMDSEGYLYFYDRATDAIRSGSKLYSSVFVENVLLQHSGVLDAAVVGAPHPELGQVVVAAVVLSSGVDIAELGKFARDRLEELAAPRAFLVAESLPRGVMGKTLKREVRTWFDPATGAQALKDHHLRQRPYW